MEVVLSPQDRKVLSKANALVKKWSKILCLDPIWNVEVSLLTNEEMENGLARIDTGSSEYYEVVIEINHLLSKLDDDLLNEELETAICHEMVHLVLIDFFRTAQIAVGDRDILLKELIYKYEQITSRLQKSFLSLIRKEKLCQ